MKAHSIELRQRIVKAVEQKTQPIAQIAQLFSVSERYVYKLLKLQRSGESLAPKAHGGGAVSKLTAKHRSTLGTLIAASPDSTLKELQRLLRQRTRVDVSITTLWRAVDALGITIKKNTARQPGRSRGARGIQDESGEIADGTTVVHR